MLYHVNSSYFKAYIAGTKGNKPKEAQQQTQ